MSCPTLNPNEQYTPDFLQQTWTGQNGVMDDTLPVDPATGIILNDAIQSKIQSLMASGVIPNHSQNPSGLAAANQALQQALSEEFCWYEQRYSYVLQQFLNAATLQQQQGGAAAAQAAQNWLTLAQQLNKRTNSVLQVIAALPDIQLGQLQASQSMLNTSNAQLQAKLRALQAGYARLNRNDAVLESQKEMVRYTEEKNHYTHNRLILWTAMNILALGAIFYVYRA